MKTTLRLLLLVAALLAVSDRAMAECIRTNMGQVVCSRTPFGSCGTDSMGQTICN
jgi:hypothetical protein